MTDLPAPLTLRPIRDDEYDRWRRQIGRQFGEPLVTEETGYRERLGDDIERAITILDGDRMVATGVNFSFRMTVPGGAQLGCAGVSGIGVQTTHRRRGLLRTMMRWLLDDARERGEPLASLLASESSIYGRFGFGPAIHALNFEIRKPWAQLAVRVDADIEMLDADEALARLPAIYDRLQRAQPGMIAPPRQWWRPLTQLDPAVFRDGFSERYVAAIADRGYVVYRTKDDWDDTGAAGTLRVEALIATDPSTAAALWQFCFDVDLMLTVTARRRPVDDPLPFLLPEPMRLHRIVDEPFYLRLVDVRTALAERSYAADGRLVLDVSDAFCPDNAGTWLLETHGGRAHCERSSQPADLSLDVEDLGATYLGGVRFSQLHRAGRVDQVAGAADRADAMFATDPLPWQPWGF